MTSHTSQAAMAVDAFNRGVNAQDASKIGETMADDVAYWEPVLPAPIIGRKAVEEHFRQGWKAFPDSRMHVTNRIVSGDWVVDEGGWTATHTGPIELPGGQTLPPTGKTVQGKAVSVVKTENGLIKQMNIYYDNMSFLAQLGLAPGP